MMIGKKMRWTAALGFAMGLQVASAWGEEVIWRPVARPATADAAPRPAATLGRPLTESNPVPEFATTAQNPVTTTSYSSPSGPTERGTIVRAQAPDSPPPVPPPASAYTSDPSIGSGVTINNGGGTWDKTREFFGFGHTNGQGVFQCDHGFDVLSSPVSNPFFFEDPRSLTEIRPLFIYQSAPKNNPLFNGGSAGFLGLQGRVALNQQWSIVLNELGFVWLNPKNGDDIIHSDTGFAEVRIGPKWTFCRNDNAGFIAATGLTFEVPVGSSKVFQHTGTLGLDPYVTMAKNFGRLPNSWGSFNFIGETGYSFGVDNQRTQFLHASTHLDYDVANLHRFYPLLELNWFYYTKGGRFTNFGFEGADLANFGSSPIGNRSYVTLAAGMRYKFSEAIQLGGAVEWPLTKEKGINDFRVTLDMIFRF